MSKSDENCIFLQILSLLNYDGNCTSHMHSLYLLFSIFISLLYLVEGYKAFIWIDLNHSKVLDFLTPCQQKLYAITYHHLLLLSFIRW